MAASPSVGQVQFDLILNSTQFRNQMQTAVNQAVSQATAQATARTTANLSGSVKSIFGKLGTMAATYFSARMLYGFTKSCIQLGSDLQEVQNVVDTTFPNMSGQVDEFARNAIKNFGLSELSAKQYVSTLGAMARGMGFAEEEAYKMGTTLTGLVGDVASFYNLSADVAYTKISSIFTGETESLKKIGVVMTEVNLNQFALAKGYGKTTKQMTQQELVALRYAYVQEKLALATGDFIRTQGSWANQTKILSMQWQSFKANLGQAFISILTPMIQYLNLFMEKLVEASARFKNFIQSIFGVQESTSTGTVTEEIAGMTDGLDSANASAKKLRKSLMGFDNLNILGSSDVGGGSTSAGIGVGEAPTENKKTGYEGTFDWSAKINELIGKVDLGAIGKKLSDGIIGAFNSMKEAISKIEWSTLGTKIGEFLKAIEWTAIATALFELLGEALNAGYKTWTECFNAAPLETTIATAVGLLTFTPLGGILASKLSTSLATALGAEKGTALIPALSGWLNKAAAGIKGCGITDASLVMGAGTLGEKFLFIGKMLGGIGMIAGGAITAIKSFVDMFVNGFSWIKEVLMVVGIALAAVGAIILGAPAAVAAAVAGVIALIATLVIAIKDNWEAICNFFKDGWNKLKDWFKEVLVNAIVWLVTKIEYLKEVVPAIFEALKTKMQEKWQSITGWFSEKFTSFRDDFVGIFEKIGETIGDIFDNVKNTIKTPINAIIGFVNKLIEALNALSIKVPDWVPEYGGKSFGFNIAKIPMLAEGGYVGPNTPQLAMIGDNRHSGEIVAPEDKLNAIVDAKTQPILSAIYQLANVIAQNQNNSDSDKTIVINIDGTRLDEFVLGANNRKALRSGGLA